MKSYNIPSELSEYIANYELGIEYLNLFWQSYGPEIKISRIIIDIKKEEVLLELNAWDGGFPKYKEYELTVKFSSCKFLYCKFPRSLYVGAKFGFPELKVSEHGNCSFTLFEYFEGKTDLQIISDKIEFITGHIRDDEFPISDELGL